MKTVKYLKSPFNYIGNKYKLLSKLLPLFPKKINSFYDIFCGGLDVIINVKAEKKYANDINKFVIEIYEQFQKLEPEQTIKKINEIILNNNLSKSNKDAYYAFRNKYNEIKDPLYLFVLVCFSFNYQFRFNSRHEFNNPAGTNRSSYNASIEQRLKDFILQLDSVEFSSKNFKDLDYSLIKKGDFVYADPPYRSSVGSYNDGKRGFEGWLLEDDLYLFKILDDLNDRGINFALSNVFVNNGKSNNELKEWSEKYKVINIKSSYLNSNYQRKNQSTTQEVLIINY